MTYHKDIILYFGISDSHNESQKPMQEQFQTFAYVIGGIPNSPEKSVAMRKLLESFDAAMRALSS